MEIGDINRREILRYLGYRGAAADAAVETLVEACLQELWAACEPRHIMRTLPLKREEGDRLELGGIRTVSRSLSRNLKDCEQVALFAATLGTGADHLIRRYERLQMSRAVVMQAASAAMIEEYCDQVCEAFRAEQEKAGWYTRPRFSPGYGDFPLSCQTALLGALEAGKRIGIKLTDSLLMMPSKSVSAVIGLSRKPHRCDVKGCEACQKTDCAYRR